MRRRDFIGGMALLSGSLAVSAVADVRRPLVGAIRWDAWYSGSPLSGILTSPRWADRTPDFATGEPGKWTIAGSDPATLSREVELARNAGIDYFLFDFSYPVGPRGYLEQWDHMSDARRSFKSLKDNRLLYSVDFGIGLATYLKEVDIEKSISGLIEEFRSGNYLKAGQRPVCFVRIFDRVNFTSPGVARDKALSYINRLRSTCEREMGKPPYLVAMTFWPQFGTDLMKVYGFDAYSSYGNPLGSGPNGPTELPYTECARLSRTFWKEAQSLRMPFLPPISVGWDNRPLLDDPEQGRTRNPKGNYCLAPEQAALAEITRDALLLAPAADPDFPSVMFYAWNEYSEGGWLAPTKGEGDRRLRALKAGIRDAEQILARNRNKP